MALRCSVRRAGAVAVASTVVAMTMLAGCGSGDDGSSGESAQPSPMEAWADDLCTSVGSWRQTMAEARTSLSSPRELSVADVEDIARDVGAATTTLVADLEDTGLPETEAGAKVQQQLTELAHQLDQQARTVEDALGGSAGTAEQLLGVVSTVAGALSTMAADTKAAVADIRETASDADLGDAFTKSPACQDLGIGAQGTG